MAQPVWITPAGSLGTIPEGKFFQLALLADTAVVATVNCTATSSVGDRITCTSTANIWPGLNVIFSGPTLGGITAGVRYFVLDVVNSTQFTISVTEFADSPVPLSNSTGSMSAEFAQHVYYYVQAGALPAGIQCSDNGLIIGVPKAVASIQGVPYEVARDVTSKFTIRGYTKKPLNGNYVLDRLSERTFTLTVTGQDTPDFTTPAGLVGTFYDGSQIEPIQIEYSDTDPADVVVITLKAGTLPPGLSLSATGLISGYIDPLPVPNGNPGYSSTGYDLNPFDFSTRSTSTNYEFVLEITDGKGANLRTFQIYVYSRDSMSADTTDFTADNTFITADETPVRIPIILNPQGSIGTVRNDNFFAYQFQSLDFDGDQSQFEITYEIGVSEIPGLNFDINTGWLYGYIPALGLTDLTYNFTVQVYKRDNINLISEPYDYSIEIIGPINTDITWTVPDNLGTINNGDTSVFYVEAVSTAGISLQYELLSGSTSSLPQGLTLLSSGDISGRVSFNTFALDSGATTFDVTFNDLGTSYNDTTTTFDMKHTFTVRAFSANGLVDVNHTFSITVNRAYNEPYENLYIQAMPPENDRALIADLLQNADIFQPDLLYRPSDPYFGRSNKVVYWHAFGLTASTYSHYISGLYENHYWRDLVLGEIKVAQARNNNDEVIYEVVYSEIFDNLTNNQGLSVSKQVTLPYPVNEADSTEISVVYPNSLINMRDQVIDTVGQISTSLPLWMISKQANGQVLGFRPAWVIAYAKPNKGNQIAYYIKEKFGERLNLVDFKVDRYELDRLLTHNWDPIADSTHGSWIPSPPSLTTFDSQAHYQIPAAGDSSAGFNGGTGYEIGDQIEILGSAVGGLDGINNITIGVLDVDASTGEILTCTVSGTALFTTLGTTYTDVSGTNIIGSGAGASFNLEVVGFDATVFDGNSVKFEAPVDMYSTTTDFDKYLVFPHRTILG